MSYIDELASKMLKDSGEIEVLRQVQSKMKYDIQDIEETLKMEISRVMNKLGPIIEKLDDLTKL
jgi:hypothetical protein